MKKSKRKTIFYYWEQYLKQAPPLVLDWITEEKDFLRKNIKSNSVIIDIGCGWGKDIKTIAKTAKMVVGIDNDLSMIKKARRNLLKWKNVKIFLENAEKTHFRDKTFDYAFCLGNTFGNFGKDKIKILREMKRIIKNNGEIFISVYSEKALTTRIKLYKKIGFLVKIARNGIIYGKNQIITEQFSKNKLKNIFDKAGLKVDIQKLNPISYICIATKK